MKRPILGLAGVLIALVVVAYLVTLKPGETSISASEGERLVELDSAAITKLEIRSPASSVVLEKRGDGWRVTSPLEDKADTAAVGSALGLASSMVVKGIVSTKAEKHDMFEVDSTGTRVTLTADGKDPVTVIVGKSSGAIGETYVRREGSDEVALVGGSLSWTFGKPLKDWRDRTVIGVPRAGITQIDYAYMDTTFSVRLQDSLWTVDGQPANQTAIGTLLSSLASLQCDDFLDTPPTQKLVAAITVSGVTVTFRHDAAGKKYYVQRSDSDRWLVIQEWRANQVLKRKKDLS